MFLDLNWANQWNKPKAELRLEIRGQMIITSRQKSASDRIAI